MREGADPQGADRAAALPRPAVRGAPGRRAGLRPPALRPLSVGHRGGGGRGRLARLRRRSRPSRRGLPSAEDLLDTSDDAPAIRLINGIIADAARQGVSDIHIEPYETGLVVRMRIDGVLRETLRMPPHVAPVVVSRVKVMARLDIAERRLPQDGRIGLTLGGKLIDVRVSTLPSRAGERVVLRILDKENAGIDLEHARHDARRSNGLFRDALAEPNGIVLVTGPTGSGKTTTLYAGLKLLNDGTRNILTVEDPVEYAVDGVGQTQINPQVGLTFAAGPARDPAAGPGRGHGRRDPRPRDRRHRRPGGADRPSRALDRPHQRRGRRDHAAARHEGRAVPDRLDRARGDRAAAGAAAVRRMPPAGRRRRRASPALLGLEPGTIVYEPRGCAACGQSGYKGRIGLFEAVAGRRRDPPADQCRRRRGGDRGARLPRRRHAGRGGAGAGAATA